MASSAVSGRRLLSDIEPRFFAQFQKSFTAKDAKVAEEQVKLHR
jgi:hypothetical protein